MSQSPNALIFCSRSIAAVIPAAAAWLTLMLYDFADSMSSGEMEIVMIFVERAITQLPELRCRVRT